MLGSALSFGVELFENKLSASYVLKNRSPIIEFAQEPVLSNCFLKPSLKLKSPKIAVFSSFVTFCASNRLKQNCRFCRINYLASFSHYEFRNVKRFMTNLIINFQLFGKSFLLFVHSVGLQKA